MSTVILKIFLFLQIKIVGMFRRSVRLVKIINPCSGNVPARIPARIHPVRAGEGMDKIAAKIP